MLAKLRVKREFSFSLLLFFLIIAVSSGCAVTLVSKYDEQTENFATEFRNNVDTFLTYLERNSGKDEAKYENNTKFYDETMVVIRGMLTRANQIPKNSITIDQVKLLEQNVKDLKKLHEKGLISAGSIDSMRSSFDTICGAIIKLEILKKRGQS